jgi:acyl-CoA thioesterase-1
LFHPFLLEGVAAVADLNQADGIHPNEKGVAMVVEGLLPAVEQLIARIESSG